MRYGKLIFILSILLFMLCFGPQTLRDLMSRLYLYQDTLILLSGTLFFGLVCTKVISNRLLDFTYIATGLVQTNYFVISPFMLVAVFLALYAVNQTVLHAFMNSGDEHSCYFLAECIRAGKLWVAPPQHAEFFNVTHVGMKGGKWFSVYPPGWPLLLAVGLSWHIENWINPIVTIVALYFIFKIGEKMYGRLVTCFSIFFMVTTSFFLMNGASYFSHSTCLLMMSIFLFAYLKWKENGQLLWSIVGAMALGYGLGTRYLTMAALAVPFLIFETIQLCRRREMWSRMHTLFAGIFLGMLFLNLHFNLAITGNYFEAPSHYLYSWERLGFPDIYTPWVAARQLIARGFFLMGWIAPVFLILYFLALRSVLSVPWLERLFLIGFLYLPFAYTLYYSWGGNQYGPRYFFEGLPLMAFAVGNAVRRWWRLGDSQLRKFLFGILIASIACNFFQLATNGHSWSTISRERKALYDLARESIQQPAIVFIRGPLGDRLILDEDDAVRNHPDLDTKIIYAHDLGEKNSILMNMFPGRTYYIGQYDRSLKKPLLVPLT